MAERHRATTGILKWFAYDHLPAHLQEVSSQVSAVAHLMYHRLPDSPELTAGLRKLLEAKDCFVRARVDASTPNQSS